MQLQLGKSAFALTLEQRIGYLSRGRANASIRSIVGSELSQSRQSRQELIREISDLLDIANIQDDLLQRIRSDVRIPAERKPQVITKLNNGILSIDEVCFTITLKDMQLMPRYSCIMATRTKQVITTYAS